MSFVGRRTLPVTGPAPHTGLMDKSALTLDVNECPAARAPLSRTDLAGVDHQTVTAASTLDDGRSAQLPGRCRLRHVHTVWHPSLLGQTLRYRAEMPKRAHCASRTNESDITPRWECKDRDMLRKDCDCSCRWSLTCVHSVLRLILGAPIHIHYASQTSRASQVRPVRGCSGPSALAVENLL